MRAFGFFALRIGDVLQDLKFGVAQFATPSAQCSRGMGSVNFQTPRMIGSSANLPALDCRPDLRRVGYRTGLCDTGSQTTASRIRDTIGQEAGLERLNRSCGQRRGGAGSARASGAPH